MLLRRRSVLWKCLNIKCCRNENKNEYFIRSERRQIKKESENHILCKQTNKKKIGKKNYRKSADIRYSTQCVCVGHNRRTHFFIYLLSTLRHFHLQQQTKLDFHSCSRFHRILCPSENVQYLCAVCVDFWCAWMMFTSKLVDKVFVRLFLLQILHYFSAFALVRSRWNCRCHRSILSLK